MTVKLHNHMWWNGYLKNDLMYLDKRRTTKSEGGKLEIELLLTGDSNRSRVVRRIMDAVEEIIEKENAKDAE
ncbi:hypothetical protein NQS42_18340 [Bacillus sp. C10(2022)]|uniref:hypothetical protein n=1 Tax=Bacillus sp. C10(2022) TaxID=2968454 RepID=UPI0033079855